MHVRFAYRRAFTVVELISVVAIIGILLSLFVPAIQMARESARRIQCNSHLRQLALAMHSYEGTHGTFPMAYVPAGITHRQLECVRFHCMLLPQLEQASLYAELQALDFSSPLDSYHSRYAKRFAPAETIIPLFRCPSTILPSLAEADSVSVPLRPDMVGYAMTDYSPSGGVDLYYGLFPVLDSITTPVYGVAAVTDGLSNTLAIGEQSNLGNQGRKFPLWAVVYGGKYDVNGINSLCRPNHVAPNASGFWRFSACPSGAVSPHPAVVNWALADGSVRTSSDAMDARLYWAVSNIADGAVISGDW